MTFEVSKHPIKINVLYLEFPHLHSLLFSCINCSLVGVFSVEVHITFLLIMWESGLPRWCNLFHQRWLYSLFSEIIIFNFNLSVMLDIHCIFFFTVIRIFSSLKLIQKIPYNEHTASENKLAWGSLINFTISLWFIAITN